MFASRSPISTRLTVIGATLLISLTLINLQITTKQRIITEGTTILLELAPRDPRSLLQGDYMALRYAMADEVAAAAKEKGVSDGSIVVELDEHGVARFVALSGDQTPSANQHLLQFRKRGETVRIASDAYFFEEGQWDAYRDAQYGELRADGAGNSVLVGLRDGERAPLGPPVAPRQGHSDSGGLARTEM